MTHSFMKELDTQGPRLPPGLLLLYSARPVPSVSPQAVVLGDLAQTWCHLVRV